MSDLSISNFIKVDRLQLKASTRIAAFTGMFGIAAIISGCLGGGGGGGDVTAVNTPLSCNLSAIKAGFKPDTTNLGGNLTVLAVQSFSKGDKLVMPNSTLASTVTPLIATADVCLVKLLVGPGYQGSEPAGSISTSNGIGIEVWLPASANWNERIRVYGSGGWTGGFHTDLTKLGANSGQGDVKHVAAFGKGYVVAHSDHGHAGGTVGNNGGGYGTWAMLANHNINTTLFQDFSERSMHVQAVITKALTQAYYGKAHKYAYWDGQSTGGRQGYKLMQKYPTDYDGYLVGAPAFNWTKFELSEQYPSQVLINDLGYSTLAQRLAFAPKVNYVSAMAVKACDTSGGLSLLLDPLSCKYDPTDKATNSAAGTDVLCTAAGGTSSSNLCVSLAEANAINKIWYGMTSDGSVPTPTTDNGSDYTLSSNAKQRWFGLLRGTNLTGVSAAGAVPNVGLALAGGTPVTFGTDMVALILGDPTYAQAATWTAAYSGNGNVGQDKWMQLTYSQLNNVFDLGVNLNETVFSHINTDSADLTALKNAGRKVIHYHGWNDEVIFPQGSLNYYNRVKTTMGASDAQINDFLRLYMIPGYAHDSNFARSGQIDLNRPGFSRHSPAG